MYTLQANAPSPPGSNIHATGSCSHVQAMTKGGAAQGYLPAKGKPIVNPALNVNNSAQQPTASASQMAARTVVTARKSATSALQTRDTEQHTAVYSTTSVDSHDENEHYELATSRRKKLKIRQRERKQQLQQLQIPAGSGAVGLELKAKMKPTETVATHADGRRRDRNARTQQLAVGRNMSSRCTVAAARPFKQVLCIDNVDMSVHEPQLTAFVSSLGVRVYTCHEVTARQTAWQRKKFPTPDHRTFRLCINRADTALLLKPDKLPSDITVSQWHFKHREPADNAAHTANAADTAGDVQTDHACENNDETIDDQTAP